MPFIKDVYPSCSFYIIFLTTKHQLMITYKKSTYIWLLSMFVFFSNSMMPTAAIASQKGKKVPKITTETYQVKGCCKQCKDRIEAAVNDIKGVRHATWDKHHKTLEVTFNHRVTGKQQILETVAAVGHDNEWMMADDTVYTALPGCCQYRGGGTCTH
jgi:periplasmic mercuric ion binding protein